MDQPSINAKSTVSLDKQATNKHRKGGTHMFIYCFDLFRKKVYLCWFIKKRQVVYVAYSMEENTVSKEIEASG